MARKYQLTQDGPEVQALLNKVEGMKANQTPGAGETPTALETLSLEGVLYSVVTKAVSDLVNYYTKSETYTKSEVNTMVAAIKQFTIQSVDQLPQPSAATTNILYLVPAEEPKVANEKDEFITVIKDGSYAWEQVGSTAVDLSDYVTTEALNDALADYVTSDALETALAGLHDVKYTAQSLTAEQKAQARTNIGATAPEVFIAVYGTTTYEQVLTAYNARKVCLCFYNEKCYVLSLCNPDVNFYFTTAMSGRIWYVRISNNDSWFNASYILELTESRVNTIVGYESATNKYPSTKAVADAIALVDKVFPVTYEQTAIADIQAAVAAGKIPVCIKDSNAFVFAREESNQIIFSCIRLHNEGYIRITKSSGVWYAGAVNLENPENKTTDIDGNKTSNTKYPTVKAVYDAIEAGKQVFWAEYGVTTTQEVEDAISANKLIVLVYQDRIYPYTSKTSQGAYTFDLVESARIYRIVLASNGTWSNTYFNVEITSNKSQSIPTDRASENKYPSVKAVADALGKWGVVSQTQTWTGNNNTGYDYTMSNQVYGLIPQANIDLYVNAGAVFNETTGYFELNGLTDISYEEMNHIYANSIGGIPVFSTRELQFSRYNYRTTLPIKFNYQYGTNLTNMFTSANFIEVVNLVAEQNGRVNVLRQNLNGTFAWCYRLKEIKGIIWLSGGTTGNIQPFGSCPSLEKVYVGNIKDNLSAQQCCRLNLESVVYMVDNAANTTAITITLHATAYARCQADTTEYTYNSQTYVGILAYASAKNITIASNG